MEKNQKCFFEIVAKSDGDNRKRVLTFSHNEHIIGTIPVPLPRNEDDAKFHPVDRAWHALLRSDTFEVPETLPKDFQEALTKCSFDYNSCPGKLRYQFLFSEDPCTWMLKSV